MAKEKEKRRVNRVKIVGFLKENNLEKIRSVKDMNVIRGSLVIATDKISSYKVQFWTPEFLYNGNESDDYKALEGLLPENTISVASYLKNNTEANFATASEVASKVWVMATLEEYASRKGERVSSITTLKGFKAGFSKTGGEKAFTPCAEFDIEVYVNKLEDEIDENETSTGRVILEGLVPKYDGSVDSIEFVAVEEDNVASYIKKNYHVGDTVTIKGDVVSIQERILKEQNTEDFFGRSPDPQYETKFIRERRILGGSAKPIKQGEEGCITAEAVREGLLKREEKMQKNGQRALERERAKEEQEVVETPAPARSVGSEDIMDF